ncbi:MAG: RNA-binding protein [Pseudolabrys sp.]
MLAIVQEDSELDRGAASVAPGTQRSCALTRALLPVSEMIRFVLGPDGAVVPDVKRKLPGRGVWITATREAIAEAVKRNVFARSFKRNLRVGGDLADEAERMLERAALDALAIAGKAGLVAAGFAKAEAALARDEAVALLHAHDGSPDGRRKLEAVRHRKTEGNGAEIAIIDAFSGEQLDLALNRPNVVHAALLPGPGSETFLARATRLMRFRTGQSPDAVGAHAQTERA